MKHTYSSTATSPTKAQPAVRRPHEEYSFGVDSSGWKYYVTAITHSSIFVITMANEQLVVNVELGLVGLFIME